MTQNAVKITIIILISLILCGFEFAVKAQGNSSKNFLLPKTFKINDAYLAPLNVKPEPKKNNVEVTSTTNESRQNTASDFIKNNKQGITKAEAKTFIVQPPLPEKNSELQKTFIQPSTKYPILKSNPIKMVSFSKSNASVSLTNLIKNYEYSYQDTLKSTIMALSSMEITPISFNTEKGQIIAKLNSGKEIFILLVPIKEDNTFLRVTPADGNYNFSISTINELFITIDNNLHSI